MVSLHPRPRGFTALELLLALAIAGLLVAFAIPGFEDLRRSAGVSSSANQILWSLHYARSAALLRGLPTVVCLSADGTRCLTNAGDIGFGWIVFHDVDRGSPPQLGGADELLRSLKLPNGFAVRGSRAAVTYWPASRAGTTATFTICPDRGNPQGRAVVVSQTGRPRVAGAVSCAT